jgi:hypothetical protein
MHILESVRSVPNAQRPQTFARIVGRVEQSDLVHNRAGQLSPDQIARQTRSLKTMTWVLGGFSALPFGIGILLSTRGDQGGMICSWTFAGGTLALLLMFWRATD